MTTSRSKFGVSQLPESAGFHDAPTEEASPHLYWVRWPIFFAIAFIGLAVRLPQLGVRPMHTDEAVNAYIVGQLLTGEPFSYDPQDRHGPALAAIALPLAWMQGGRSFSELTESELRLTSVVAGACTILLFGAAVEMFGFIPCAVGALLFAVSPMPVYYGRYFIHESLFCAATLGLILSGRRAFESRSFILSALAGACAAFMFASKETTILHWFTMATGAVVFWLWNLRGKSAIKSLHIGLLLAAAGTFLLLVVILFTWFGRNGRGLSTLWLAVPFALARAGGQGHEKPFLYYGRLLATGWSGGLLLGLACLGLFITFRKRDASAFQWLGYYGLLLAAIYSLIPYKTPWLALNLLLPLALFAGKAVETAWHWSRRELSWHATVPIFCVLVASACLLIGHDTRRYVFLRASDEGNPYAYAHTSEDILGLPAEIAELARQGNIGTPRIAVIASDPWPLPWYLRHFNQVVFYQPGQNVADADFFITSTEAAERYADQLRGFRPEFFGVRPGILILLWSPEPK